ncbi:substrate-binding domain-containing protein [Bradyrhizobium sp. Ec3.3]|uniref:substrate-binding domain-containing protein n=1 Tax=Bradyrhizobium sp. Ec3.3 TaxID=189753 RepID=UPI003528F904
MRGEVDLAIQQIPELRSVEGIELVGPLPSDLQAHSVFGAGIPITTRAPDAARAFWAKVLLAGGTRRRGSPSAIAITAHPVGCPFIIRQAAVERSLERSATASAIAASCSACAARTASEAGNGPPLVANSR